MTGHEEHQTTGTDDYRDYWWYNSTTHEIAHGPKSLAHERIGPFDTRHDAERAHEIVAERSKQWAEHDARED